MQLQRRAAVGCGPRPAAAHDRQAVRKHLRRWSHNMVLVIGLERIAEELMGRRKWHQYQDILAKNYLLEEELMNRREWVPVKTCNSCDVNTDLSVTDHSPAELEPSSETGSLSGGSRSAESPEPQGGRPSCTPPPAALKPCRAHDRSPSPPPTPSSLLQELSKNPAAAAAAMAAVVSLNNSSSSSSSSAKTPATGGPPSPDALDAAAMATGLPQWLLIEATRRLQETTVAAAAAAAAAAATTRSRSPPPAPERRHHHIHHQHNINQQQQQQQQQQQRQPPPSSDQPLDLSAKSNSNNNGSSSPSDAKHEPGPSAIVPFPSDLIAADMVNSLSNLIPNASLLQSFNVPLLGANNRNVFKSKTTRQPNHMAGRKTYTEDELQKALQDIQSGKLGTRRAAVIYGIPRSTLRNKVYKMAMVRDSGGTGTRDASSAGDGASSGVAAAIEMQLNAEEEDDDDRDTASAGEDDCGSPKAVADTARSAPGPATTVDEDKDGRLHPAPPSPHHRQQPKTPSFVTVEDLLRITTEQHQQQQQQQQQAAAAMPTTEAIRLFLQHYSNSKLLQQTRQHEHHRDADARRTEYRSPSPPPPPLPTARLPPPVAPDLWPASVLDPSKYLAQFLSTGTSQRSPSSPPPPSLPSQLQLLQRPRNPQEFLKDMEMMDMMNKLLEDEQKRYGKSADWRRRWSSNGCGAPESTAAVRCNDDDSDSPNYILRVPSYKTAPGGKGSEYEWMTEGGGGGMRSPPERANSVRSDTSSPPSSSGGGGGEGKHPVSLRDVIAKSITYKFQTGADPPALHHMPAVDSITLAYHQYQQQHQQQQQGVSGPATFRNHNNNNLLEDYRKRVPTPTTKPSSVQQHTSTGSGSGGSFLHMGGSSNSSASAAAAAAAAAAGGKGTRPKRGKYRNYDRDSLVEAVRAVQRGEMSVHRAGSYYGVPHSTLEYKVKERHLLRTRKREPKNRPAATSVSADTVVAELQDRKKSCDLLSPQSSSSSSSVRPAVSIVDKGAASSAGCTQSAVKLPTHAFPSSQQLQAANGLKMFDAAAGVPAAAAAAYQSTFPFWAPSPFHLSVDFQRNPVQAYASMSMMQRIQAESRMHHHQQQQQVAAAAAATASIASLGKSAREVAESLYDGTDNGSFLDGIIRSSLETGLKSAMAAARTADESGGAAVKRPAAVSDYDGSPERTQEDHRSPSPPPPPHEELRDDDDGRSEDGRSADSACSADGDNEKPAALQTSSSRAASASPAERAINDDDDRSPPPPAKVQRIA